MASAREWQQKMAERFLQAEGLKADIN